MKALSAIAAGMLVVGVSAVAQPTITAMSIGWRGVSRRTKPTRNFMTDSILPGWTSDHWYALAVPRFTATPDDR